VPEEKRATSPTPEELAHDYLIGLFEVDKLRNGFQVPVEPRQECDDVQK